MKNAARIKYLVAKVGFDTAETVPNFRWSAGASTAAGGEHRRGHLLLDSERAPVGAHVLPALHGDPRRRPLAARVRVARNRR